MKNKTLKWFLIIAGIVSSAGILIFFLNRKVDFKYFNYTEFDSPATQAQKDDSNVRTYYNALRLKYYLTDSAKNNMNAAFIRRLDDARAIAGVPFFITSGYRTPEYNATLADAVSDSAHTKGLAADIAAPTEAIRKKIISALIAAGFRRIGEGATFVHVDDDRTKPQNAYWNYGSYVGQNPFYA